MILAILLFALLFTNRLDVSDDAFGMLLILVLPELAVELMLAAAYVASRGVSP